MISTTWRPRTWRLLIAGLILSVLIHLFGGLFVSFIRHVPILESLLGEKIKREDRLASQPDVITIERVPAAQPARSRPAAAPPAKFVPPHPVARAHVPRPVVTVPPEIYHQVSKPAPAHPHTGGRPDNAPQPRAVAVERPQPQHGSNRLTTEQIANLEAQFSQTIQSTRQDLSATVAQVNKPVAGPKHYVMGSYGGLHPGEGYYVQVRSRRIDRTHMAYFIHYTYMYDDGHVEEDTIPWEYVYRINDDAIARHDRVIEWQAPPPGFQPTRQLSPLEQEMVDAPSIPKAVPN